MVARVASVGSDIADPYRSGGGSSEEEGEVVDEDEDEDGVASEDREGFEEEDGEYGLPADAGPRHVPGALPSQSRMGHVGLRGHAALHRPPAQGRAGSGSGDGYEDASDLNISASDLLDGEDDGEDEEVNQEDVDIMRQVHALYHHGKMEAAAGAARRVQGYSARHAVEEEEEDGGDTASEGSLGAHSGLSYEVDGDTYEEV